MAVRLMQDDTGYKVADKRLILFAIFFDSKKTVAEGRKVPAALSCESPNLRDVAECLSVLHLPFEFQVRSLYFLSSRLRAQRRAAGWHAAQGADGPAPRSPSATAATPRCSAAACACSCATRRTW